MSAFFETLRFILRCHAERWENRHEYVDTSSRTRFLGRGFSNSARDSHLLPKSLPRTSTSPNPTISFPSDSSYEAKVIVYSGITNSMTVKSQQAKEKKEVKSQQVQETSKRTTEVFQNLKDSSSLEPSLSYTCHASSSKLPPSSSPFLFTLNPPISSKPSLSSPKSSSKPSVSSSAVIGKLQVSSQPPSPSTKPPVSSANASPSSSKLPISSTSLPLSSATVLGGFPSSTEPKTSSSKPSLSLPTSSKLPPPSSNTFLSSSKSPVYSLKSSLSSLKGPPLPSGQSSSFPKGPPLPSGPSSSSPKPPHSCKPFLSQVPSNVSDEQNKKSYVLVEKSTLPIYAIPKNIEGLIERDIVPEVLKRPLSAWTYKDYFASLLYAEEFYVKKWENFQLKNVTLELHEAVIFKKSSKKSPSKESKEKDDKIFVAFEISSVPERRPFLLSRDFVHARPSGEITEPFQGIIYGVKNSSLVLVEFKDDFHSQHHWTYKYDISFTFNRVCLKRAHQAVEAASDPFFQNFLFPEQVFRKNILDPPSLLPGDDKHNLEQSSAIRQILRLRGSPLYLVAGPPCVSSFKRDPPCESYELSKTGNFVQEAVRQIYQTSPASRILVCAPTNFTSDGLMRSLMRSIPKLEMFRANAAFRQVEKVDKRILRLCPYNEECFICPSLLELQKFRVIFSTYMSSFRLHNEGITANHFSHIFLVDVSSVIEPEAIVPLAHLANENTTVVVTGDPRNHPGYIRSAIARQYGLQISYLERLQQSRANCLSHIFEGLS